MQGGNHFDNEKNLQYTAPDLSRWMADNLEQGLTIMTIAPPHQWQRLRTSNLAERVNREVKRRTRISSLFPNPAACLRLVSAVLVEIDEMWQDERNVYLKIDVE